jgi:glycosyltransferase involved in cell wall biosynthesis
MAGSVSAAISARAAQSSGARSSQCSAAGGGAPAAGAGGARPPGLRGADRLVRVWAWRRTLHLLAADDAAWVLSLVAPGAIRSVGARWRQLGLDEAVYSRARDVLAEAVAEEPRTRAQLRERLAAADAPAVTASSFALRAGEAAAALARIAPEDRIVVFVGKLIASKGAELLLAAWPLVLAREPRARLVVVGFGAFREGLEALAARLAAGDLAGAAATVGEEGRPLPQLAAFLEGLAAEEGEAYRAAARALPERIVWTGRLDHAQLADLLPAAEAIAVPSTFPEAFGMVAAEAAACGALPVVADHSGLAEVAQTLAAAVPEEARPWLSFEVGPGAVQELADALSAWLEAPEELRAATRRAIVAATRERYSWDGVARTVIAAARGELDGLAPVPATG